MKNKYKKCSVCHKNKLGVKKIVDPFIREVYGQEKRRNICRKCKDFLAEQV